MAVGRGRVVEDVDLRFGGNDKGTKDFTYKKLFPTEADGRLMTWRTDATNRRADIRERSGLVAPSWNLRIQTRS